MINLNLNLISAEQRIHLEQKRSHLLFEKLFISIFLLIFIISLSLGVGKYLLNNNYNQLVSENGNQRVSSFNQDIKELNTKLKLINKIQSDYNPVAEKVDFLIKIVPANIFLTNLKIEKKEEDKNYYWLISLNGRAKTRKDLLDLKTNLNQTNGFSEVDFPISNLLKKENIDFQLMAKLKNDVFNL